MYLNIIVQLVSSLIMAISNANSAFVVGHRGASFDAPENTISAFELAWEEGADAVEGDFHLTADGEIVCIHDATTKKVADKDLIVKNSTLAELKKLDVGVWKGQQWVGTRIPTLAELFATVPNGKKIYVEIKCGVQILPKLIQEIDKSALEEEQIVVISFDPEVIKEFKLLRPKISANWLLVIDEVLGGGLSTDSWLAIQLLKAIRADGISTNYQNVTQEMVSAIKNAGFEYHVWTVDDVQKAKLLHEFGVNSITTNRPQEIIQVLP